MPRPKNPKPIRTEEERNALMLVHLRLVGVSIRRFYRMNPHVHNRYPVEDAESWARIGLLKACTYFKEELGNAFSTFACRCIWRSIYRGYYETNLVHIPEWHIHASFNEGKQPSWVKVMFASAIENSNSTNLGNKGYNQTVGDSWSPPDASVDIGKEVERNEISNRVRQCINLLHPKYRDILVKRFLHEMTLTDIGKEMGVSRERVRQLVKKGRIRLEVLMREEGLDKEKLM